MAYQANRDGNQNEKNVGADRVRGTANVLKHSANPYAKAAGVATSVADKVTKGKSSEFLASKMPKVLTNEHDLGKKLRDAASMRGYQNVPKSSNNSEDKQDNKSPASSRSSSSETSNDNKEDKEDKKDNPAKGVLSFLGKAAMVKTILFFTPILFIGVILCSATSGLSEVIGNFNDLFGISAITGGETGNVNASMSPEQQEFYERVNQVKLTLQSQGKNVDVLKIVSVFTALKNNKANIDYSSITTAQIEEVANSMLLNNQYDETTFKNNLKNNIIPKYLPNSTSKDSIVNEIIKSVSDYNDLVGTTDVNSNSSSSSNCVSTDTCNYSLKGFSISGKGNILESLNISNLYVRLMQCGVGNGHNYGGTFGKALANEELVPFEKYILGVAYNKYDSSTPNEAIKAQMVADRSFILGRHADLGGWRTLKKENGRWILQAASCTQDRVYCDPDKGCSSNDAEWGMVHSGLNNVNGYSKQPLSESSTLRNLAKEVAGEVLADKQGYVVYTNSNSTDWNKFVSLANKGYNYKQILVEVYNQGNRNYGVSNLLKGSCSKTTSCQASGDYASWRQNQGPWVNVRLGSSGRTIKQIGCLATSVAILIAKSGVQTNVTPFNPGTFVKAMSKAGGFGSYGDMMYGPVSSVAPNFRYAGQVYVLGEPESQKLLTLGNLLYTGYYVVAEVKGNTGQHWVAVDSIQNGVINMMDPGTNSTNMWKTYPSRNTSRFVYFKAN